MRHALIDVALMLDAVVWASSSHRLMIGFSRQPCSGRNPIEPDRTAGRCPAQRIALQRVLSTAVPSSMADLSHIADTPSVCRKSVREHMTESTMNEALRCFATVEGDPQGHRVRQKNMPANRNRMMKNDSWRP
jgi:hypothetical protein